MHRPNQAPQRLLTAALAGLVVACSLEIDESQLSGRERGGGAFRPGKPRCRGGTGSWDGEATWSWSPS